MASGVCRLSRQYASDRGALEFHIEQAEPDGEIDLSLSAPMFSELDRRTAIALWAGPKPAHRIGAAGRQAVMRGGEGEDVRTLLFDNIRLNGERDAPKAGSVLHHSEIPDTPFLTIVAGTSGISLDTASLRAAMAGMRQCTDALVKSWGLDPAKQARLTRRPAPSQTGGWWLGPSPALRGDGKIAQIRVLISAEGKPRDCRVVGSYNDQTLAQGACKSLTTGARFKPALDEHGKPAASFEILHIRTGS